MVLFQRQRHWRKTLKSSMYRRTTSSVACLLGFKFVTFHVLCYFELRIIYFSVARAFHPIVLFKVPNQLCVAYCCLEYVISNLKCRNLILYTKLYVCWLLTFQPSNKNGPFSLISEIIQPKTHFHHKYKVILRNIGWIFSSALTRSDVAGKKKSS